jgi:hypothetical protein
MMVPAASGYVFWDRPASGDRSATGRSDRGLCESPSPSRHSPAGRTSRRPSLSRCLSSLQTGRTAAIEFASGVGQPDGSAASSCQFPPPSFGWRSRRWTSGSGGCNGRQRGDPSPSMRTTGRLVAPSQGPPLGKRRRLVVVVTRRSRARSPHGVEPAGHLPTEKVGCQKLRGQRRIEMKY